MRIWALDNRGGLILKSALFRDESKMIECLGTVRRTPPWPPLLKGGRRVLVCIAVLCWGSLLLAAEPAVVIHNGTLFDSVAGKMLPDRTVVIQRDKITAVGSPEKPAEVPAGAQVIDGRGKFILPGLIDAHVHLVHRVSHARMTGDEILPLFLGTGVTSVRDTGDEIYGETMVARFADAHPETCPRVFRCSGLLDGANVIHRDIGIPIANPEAVPAIVADMAAWGVTTLKIYAGTQRPVGRKVIEEGHKHGKVVTAHLIAYSAQDAVADGVDCLEHITTVFDFIIPPEVRKDPDHRANLDLTNPIAKELVETLSNRKVIVDPTLAVFRNMLLLSDLPEIQRHPDVLKMPERLVASWDEYRQRSLVRTPETLERRRKTFRKYQDLTGILYRAGVPLLAGTDAPEPYCPPGYSLHMEFEYLAESGLPPAAILQAATINNARSLKQEAVLGSIEAGKQADIILLTADPLADIRNTRKIEKVIHAGIVCDPELVLAKVPKK